MRTLFLPVTEVGRCARPVVFFSRSRGLDAEVRAVRRQGRLCARVSGWQPLSPSLRGRAARRVFTPRQPSWSLGVQRPPRRARGQTSLHSMGTAPPASTPREAAGSAAHGAAWSETPPAPGRVVVGADTPTGTRHSSRADARDWARVAAAAETGPARVWERRPAAGGPHQTDGKRRASPARGRERSPGASLPPRTS